MFSSPAEFCVSSPATVLMINAPLREYDKDTLLITVPAIFRPPNYGTSIALR